MLWAEKRYLWKSGRSFHSQQTEPEKKGLDLGEQTGEEEMEKRCGEL